ERTPIGCREGDRAAARRRARGDRDVAVVCLPRGESRRGRRGEPAHGHRRRRADAHVARRLDIARSRITEQGGSRLMSFPSLENALNKASNRYLLFVFSPNAARRTNGAAAAGGGSKQKKRTGVALDEIRQGKFEYRVREWG